MDKNETFLVIFKQCVLCEKPQISNISDSGVESSATNIGFESAISDNEHPPPNLEDEGSPAPAPPSLEDAMQRLAETIKEFDSHAMTDQEDEKTQGQQNITNGEQSCQNGDGGEQQKSQVQQPEKEPQNKQNLSQGQISIFFLTFSL